MRGSAARALLPGLAVLALIGVVAVAATGSTRGGSDQTGEPSEFVLDTLFTLAFFAVVPALALLVYGLAQRKSIAVEIRSKKYRRFGPASFIVFFLLFAVFWYLILPRRLGSKFQRDNETLSPENLGPRRPVRPESEYEPELAWIPLLVVLALITIGVGAYFIVARRTVRAPYARESKLAEEVADEVDESLDDLRAEPDARRAVIAAYARLERALGASGVARTRQETAEEYVARILGKLEVDDHLVRRLADLFTRAKFSHHVVDETMREEAITALAQIRDELRAAASLRLEKTMRKLAERTATL